LVKDLCVLQVEKWWLQGAYLSLREPLIPFYSMCGALPLNDLGWTLGNGKGIYQHAAQYLHCLVAFWVILRKELLLPSTSADKKTYFSMSQFRFLFNTNRVPQEHCDNLANFFKTEKEGDCPSHVIILSNGRIFRVNALAPDGAPISFSEWLKILTKIAAITSEEKGPGIPILTWPNTVKLY
ncbi:peroxisomal carnitine O-octanoyltransferase-like, partial [Gryllus bimaculatus]